MLNVNNASVIAIHQVWSYSVCTTFSEKYERDSITSLVPGPPSAAFYCLLYGTGWGEPGNEASCMWGEPGNKASCMWG